MCIWRMWNDSRMYLGCISDVSSLYIGCILGVSRVYLCCIYDEYGRFLGRMSDVSRMIRDDFMMILGCI